LNFRHVLAPNSGQDLILRRCESQVASLQHIDPSHRSSAPFALPKSHKAVFSNGMVYVSNADGQELAELGGRFI
jgi:hypothetical protein